MCNLVWSTVFGAALLALGGCEAASSRPAVIATASPRPTITLAHDSDDERLTMRQVESLLDRHDLTPWMFAPTIAIDRDASPHSHPVLTLHTRHLKDDLLLLSTLIHEESHWYFEQHAAATAAAIAELETAFPGLPVGYPDGANDVRGSYEHLMVILCEQQGMRDLTGELAARQVMEFWATDHYRVLYRTVMDGSKRIREIMKSSGLMTPRSRDRVPR